MTGSANGSDREGRVPRTAIDLFIEDGAYTTVASAVSMLVVLTLAFSTVTAVWTMSRAGDVQVAADATALAGANVVASYHTAATVVDACVLSLGLTGMVTLGVGLAGMLVPGAEGVAGKAVDAGRRMIETRNKFATSASKGLQKVEASLPYLVAANGLKTCLAQSSDATSYTGMALAVPTDSDSDFPAIAGQQIETEELGRTAEALEEAARELRELSEEAADRKEEAWLADCGGEPRSMRERAAALSGLSASQNPDYASSITWDPQVGLDRARAYYAWRLEHEAPEGAGIEARADSAARRAFYRFACSSLEAARIEEADGRLVSNVPLLPRNTDEVRATELFTESVWPSTVEEGGLRLHCDADCPGARGAPGPSLALADIESGRAATCPSCSFDVGDVGRAPAASTSIDNGFEYHLRAFTEALGRYAEARNQAVEAEDRARGESGAAADAFEKALSVLSGRRPRIAPPGRDGCVAVVVAGAASSPEELENAFAPAGEVPVRGAVSAAVLARDEATAQNNVLSAFFSGLEERTGGGGVVGLVGDVMELWGAVLMSYGNLADGLDGLMDRLLGGLDALGGGALAEWLSNRVDGAVRGLDLQPVDMSLRKPVLTDSANVIARSDVPALADVQGLLRSIPLGSTDPAALAELAGQALGDYLAGGSFTLAEIPLPGGGSIPLDIDLGGLAAEGRGSR